MLIMRRKLENTLLSVNYEKKAYLFHNNAHFCLKICEKGFPLCAKAATPLLRNVNAQLQFYG